MPGLLQRVREMACRVAAQADEVRIDLKALPAYAASLPMDRLALPEMDPAIHFLGEGSSTVAYLFTLDAVNFGSGYFPEILGNPRSSGYRFIAAALTRHFREHGPIPAGRLRTLGAADCAAIFGLDLTRPVCDDLMGLFARALNDLGTFLAERFLGDFEGPLRAAAGSAERLVELLSAMPLFDDQAPYRDATIPFYKRAQLTAADLVIAFGGRGPGCFHDLDRLTICADNLVPHVLRLDGVLHYREALLERIERGEPLIAGSPEEVEIRGCAIHAAELLLEELRRRGMTLNAMQLDNFLWHRGQEGRYREAPRHRTRTVFY